MNLTPLVGCFFVLSAMCPLAFSQVQPVSEYKEVSSKMLSHDHVNRSDYLNSFFSHLPKYLAFTDKELNMTGLICQYLHFCPQQSLQSDLHMDVEDLPDAKLLGYDHLKKKKAVKPKQYTMLDGKDIFVKNCMSCHLASDNEAPQLANFEDWSWRIQSSFDFLVRVTIEGQQAYEKSQLESPNQNASRYLVGSVETVPKTQYDDRVRGCILPRGGCKDCDDAQIIAAVKYMVQAAVTDNANYQLW